MVMMSGFGWAHSVRSIMIDVPLLSSERFFCFIFILLTHSLRENSHSWHKKLLPISIKSTRSFTFHIWNFFFKSPTEMPYLKFIFKWLRIGPMWFNVELLNYFQLTYRLHSKKIEWKRASPAATSRQFKWRFENVQFMRFDSKRSKARFVFQ